MISNDLNRILKDLKSGNFRKTRDADQQMILRGKTAQDIACAAESMSRFKRQGDGVFQISGLDHLGDRLNLVATWSGETVLVTLLGD